MKISDYAKVEKLKRFITTQLTEAGMTDQAKTINDDDLNTMVYAMGVLGNVLRDLTEEEKINYLIYYTIVLWGRIIVDYGGNIDDIV